MNTDVNVYDEDYYMRGKETGKSLYENYTWRPELTIPMVASMIRHLGIRLEDSILDFGCARGYTVRAFREMGYDVWGYDTSKWAIDNADELVKDYVKGDSTLFTDETTHFDWIIAKDVLEHVENTADVIADLMAYVKCGMFVVVPLSSVDGQKYVVPSYEEDVTHIHRLTLATWARMFMKPGWSVNACYRVQGIKDNYYKEGWEMGNGFITCRRMEK